MTDLPETIEPTIESAPRKSIFRRPGCLIGLAIWAVLILSPCIIGILVTTGEVSLTLGSAPGQQLRIWLIDEVRERGLGISTPAVFGGGSDATAMCVQTDVRYLLWAGSADPVSYCECYLRPERGGEWNYSTTTQGACTAQE
jgi:hypothetical protein